MRDKIVELIEDILDQTFLREDCKTDSLVRIDDEECYCKGCIMSSAISTVGIGDNIGDVICPLMWKRETRVFR